jgi:hypothetical protein
MPDTVDQPEHVEPVAPEVKQAVPSMGDRFRQALEGKIPEKKPDEPQKQPEQPTQAATAAPASKPDETSTPDPVAGASPKAREQFQRLEEKARAEEQKRLDLEKRLAQLEEGSKAAKDIEAKLKAAEERANEAELFRKRYFLEHDPQFVSHYDGKINQAIAKAKLLAGSESARDVEKIFKLPPGEYRDEAVRSLKEKLPDEAPAIISVYADLQLIQQEREAELDRTKLEFNWSKLKERDEEAARQQQAKAIELRNQFWEKVSPEIDEELKPLEELAKDDVPKARQLLRSLVSGEVDAETYAKLVKATARGIKAEKTEAKKDEMIRQLTDQVAALKSATPGIKTTGESKPVEKTPQERWREAMGQLERT